MSEERGKYETGENRPGETRSLPVEQVDFIGLEIEGLELCQWHPTPDPADSAPEQVHLIVNIGDKDLPIQSFVFRFKGPHTLDQLVDQMVAHRVEVWGPRGTGFAAAPTT